jgi:hypothetical protein
MTDDRVFYPRVETAFWRTRMDEATSDFLTAGKRRDLFVERFTLGGAELVLKVCAPSSLEESFETQRRWLEQLDGTPGVDYVERNLVAQHEDAPGPSPS